MACIYVWHIIMHGYNFKDIGTSGFELEGNAVGLTFLCSLFVPADNCFVFVSGWYGMNFKVKKFLRLVFLSFVCSVISLFIILYVFDVKLIAYKILLRLFPISTGLWWFLTAYLTVYMISPVIEKGLYVIEKKSLDLMMLILTLFELFTEAKLVPNMGSTLFGILYIYLLGRYFRIRKFALSQRQSAFIFFTSLIILWTLCFVTSQMGGGRARYAFIILSLNNPLVVMMAIALFFLVYQMKPTYNKRINSSLSGVLAIYLLTEGVGPWLYSYNKSLVDSNMPIGILFAVTIIVVTLLAGYIINELYNSIYDKSCLRTQRLPGELQG